MSETGALHGSASAAARRSFTIIAILIVATTAVILIAMGRAPICKCGTVKLWHGIVLSSENSQHIADWYTFSHIIHGFIFYGLLWLVGRNWSLGLRLCLALVLECGWEIFENTDFIIDRYREQTISLDYHGDSVLNSISDALAMVLGFFAAAWLPIWVTIATAIALELFAGIMIRDNLTLNIIMLIWPLDFIRDWQSGG